MSDLKFGVNPFDKVPAMTGRYHLVDQGGFILWKSDYGIIVFDEAGNQSDKVPDTTFSAIDTRDGSVYGAWRNGEVVA